MRAALSPASSGAIRAAGIDQPRRIYDLPHTYATLSLAAGVSLFSLARRMGTSVEMIDRTYGQLAPDAEEYERGLLDAYDAKTEAFGQLSSREGGE
jgi:integrase